MSESGRAVFLSYASQDAAVVARLCDALRAAGVEVWFDQSELVGGDAWDAKIRRQIAGCALFVPVISAHTDARLEGYFRLEWKLAAQRTHTMADEKTFLLPVAIDATRDAGAKVPAEFKAVQWTRLPEGEGTEKFCARVQALLEGGERLPLASEHAGPLAHGRRQRAAPRRRLVPLLVGLTVLAAAAGFVALRPKAAAEKSPPLTEARKLAAQARALLLKPGGGATKFETAALLCERALGFDNTDAEIWGVASQVDTRLWFHALDRTEKRGEAARSKAARAINLDGGSFEGRLAQATYLVLVAGEPTADQAEPVLRALRTESPPEFRVLSVLASLLQLQGKDEAALAVVDEAARVPGGAVEARGNQAWILHRLRRIPEMEAALDEAIAQRPVAGAISLRTFYDLEWHGDLDRALGALRKLPAEELAEDNGIASAVQVYRWRREPAELLKFLGGVPRDWIAWSIRGPKAALTGDANAELGRAAAARTDWQSALALVDQRLASTPSDRNLLQWRAYLLAALGETDRAREACARSLEAPPVGLALHDVEKIQRLMSPSEVVDELERRVRSTQTALERHAQVLDRFVSAADLRLNPAWDGVRALPRFQALQARLDADPRFNPKAVATASAAADAKSIAVLAFANRSDDAANEIFSDGISEELINLLGRVPGLTVKGRSSSFYFKGRDATAQEKGQRLGAAYLVDGSVRKFGSNVRITAQLIRAATDEVVWSSEPITKELKDVLAVQEEIAGLIAQNLQLKLGAAARPARPVNPDAHRLVLEGRNFWNSRTEEGHNRAEAAFRKALEADPDFAPAHAGLALMEATRVAYAAYAGESRRPPERLWTEARRALELDPELAEGHAALAYGFFSDGRAADAEREYQQALALNPNSALLHHWYSLTLERAGRLDAALAEITTATTLDPLSGIALVTRERMAVAAGRYTEALEMHERAIGVLPEAEAAYGFQALSLLQLGRAEEAAAAARRVSPQSSLNRRVNADAWVVHVLRQTGHAAEAASHAAQIMPRLRADSYQRGCVLAAQGRWAEAVPFLERTPMTVHYLFYWDPTWDVWRNDPRFAQLMAKLGCTEEYRVARETLARMKGAAK